MKRRKYKNGTPCFVLVRDEEQASALLKKVKAVGNRRIVEAQENPTYPCICAVSTNIISICDFYELTSAGFTDCKDNEEMFLSLAAQQ